MLVCMVPKYVSQGFTFRYYDFITVTKDVSGTCCDTDTLHSTSLRFPIRMNITKDRHIRVSGYIFQLMGSSNEVTS